MNNIISKALFFFDFTMLLNSKYNFDFCSSFSLAALKYFVKMVLIKFLEIPCLSRRTFCLVVFVGKLLLFDFEFNLVNILPNPPRNLLHISLFKMLPVFQSDSQCCKSENILN